MAVNPVEQVKPRLKITAFNIILGLFLLFFVLIAIGSVITFINELSSQQTIDTSLLLTMSNDPNFQSVLESYSNNSFGDKRGTAIYIIETQFKNLYPALPIVNLQGLMDTQLYSILTTTNSDEFYTYIQTYFPAFGSTDEPIKMYNDPNFQTVFNSYSNNSFDNTLYGDARNAAIIITQDQLAALYPSMERFNLQGLNDVQLHNLLSATSSEDFKEQLRTYYPDRNF